MLEFDDGFDLEPLCDVLRASLLCDSVMVSQAIGKKPRIVALAGTRSFLKKAK